MMFKKVAVMVFALSMMVVGNLFSLYIWSGSR